MAEFIVLLWRNSPAPSPPLLVGNVHLPSTIIGQCISYGALNLQVMEFNSRPNCFHAIHLNTDRYAHTPVRRPAAVADRQPLHALSIILLIRGLSVD